MGSHIPLPDLEKENQEFRVTHGTMDEKGNRKWVFPRKPPKRKYYKRRELVAYFLLAILFIIPWIRINGNPLFKFDVIKREFFLFSFPFFTTDFYILAIAAIATLIFITLFTVIYGRLFCGWVCPQTIFLEWVFRPIEYAIEGDRNKQMRLDRQDWTEEKIRKKSLKWLIYFIISFVIANVFLSYIIGTESLTDLIKEGPIKNKSTFFGLLAFTGFFYFIFAWFREQACVLVCPYGRLQGALIDQKTMVVAYDYKRGEGENGRAKFKKNEDRTTAGHGDCIDCGQCVAVCPTGIDIRNGTQLECVNCTACMDACDEIMERIDLPTGLIRYASEENIDQGKPWKFTTRMAAYSVALLVLIGIVSVLLLNRSDVESKFLRQDGSQFKIENNQTIVNEYQFTLMNKSTVHKKLSIQLLSHKGSLSVITGPSRISLEKNESKQGSVLIKINQSELKNYNEEIKIGVFDQNNQLVDTYTTNFAGPIL